MTFTALDSFGKVNLMMDLVAQRQRALGSNVANVDTPGYVRRDIDFGMYLGSMNKNNWLHLGALYYKNRH